MRRTLGGLAAGGLLFTAANAEAQDRSDLLTSRHHTYESPQNFAAELRFSSFTPDIDSDPALHGTTPYQSIFGTTPRILVGLEVDWQAFRIPHFGTIGPGLGVGYTKMSAPAPFVQQHNGQTLSGEDTALEIFPFDLVAVLRVDVLWREVGIPFVPYAKLGAGLSLWRSSNTLGTSSVGGVSAKGHSLGAHAALGLAFNLNAFDEYAAKNFDEAMGVNNSYIFAEWTRDDLTGLGLQQNVLRVGGTYWTFGLAFEF